MSIGRCFCQQSLLLWCKLTPDAFSCLYFHAQAAMRVYVTSWQSAHPCSHAIESKHISRRTAARSAMLWTFTNGQIDAQCSEARPYRSNVLGATSMVLQRVQEGSRQAIYASLTAFASLPGKLMPSHMSALPRMSPMVSN